MFPTIEDINNFVTSTGKKTPKTPKVTEGTPLDYRQILVVNEKNGPSLFADVLDIGHTAWLALELDSQGDVDQWDLDTKAWMLSQFGLDFDSAVYVPAVDGWSLTIPGGSALMIPYKLVGNNTYRVRMDTKYPWRAVQGDWYVNGFGNIVILNGAGTFTGGVAVGTAWKQQDILSYNIWQYRKDGDLWKITEQFRERISANTEYPVISPANSQGIRGQLFHEVVKDKNGEPGTAWLSAQTQKDYVTGDLFTVTTNYTRLPGYGQ